MDALFATFSYTSDVDVMWSCELGAASRGRADWGRPRTQTRWTGAEMRRPVPRWDVFYWQQKHFVLRVLPPDNIVKSKLMSLRYKTKSLISKSMSAEHVLHVSPPTIRASLWFYSLKHPGKFLDFAPVIDYNYYHLIKTSCCYMEQLSRAQ